MGLNFRIFLGAGVTWLNSEGILSSSVLILGAGSLAPALGAMEGFDEPWP